MNGCADKLARSSLLSQEENELAAASAAKVCQLKQKTRLKLQLLMIDFSRHLKVVLLLAIIQSKWLHIIEARVC